MTYWMTYSGTGISITTWSLDSEGQQTWKARDDQGRAAEFTATRGADPMWLSTVAGILLGHPLSPNAVLTLEQFPGGVEADPPQKSSHPATISPVEVG